jgi:sugar lactone lactonase YvrE/enterochelin esterase-like enzyme
MIRIDVLPSRADRCLRGDGRFGPMLRPFLSLRFEALFMLLAATLRRLAFSLATISSLAGVSLTFAQQPDLSPDSLPQEGVPQGEIKVPIEWKSEIFPGTVRNYWVYVPKQYDGSKPACVAVVQDGLGRAKGWNLTTVMDNLIHKQEMPVTIGIFIDPGVVPAPNENAQPRFNRSYEYDAVGDRYARFLIEEILPEVGKTYKLSDNPDDRMIAGASSGAICAFNVAWERPDQFRRVLSTIGTYVGLRGADEFPTLIRKCENKPLRVFLQDGTEDLDIYAGDWFIANQDMLSALQYAGYDVDHAWGEGGGHDSKHSAEIMPQAMKWLWRDYGKPLEPGVAPNRRVDLLIPGEGWKLVSDGHKFTEGPAVSSGELLFTDIPNDKIHLVTVDGEVRTFVENSGGANGLAVGEDGKLYACRNKDKQIVRYDVKGNMEVVIEGVESNDLALVGQGGYFTDPANKKVHRFTFDGKHEVVDEGIDRPNGIVVSSDRTLLTVADTTGRFTYSFQIQPDGKLAYKQTYGWLHTPDSTSQSGADGMAVDREGRIYVATRMGVQVLDQPGRVNLIIDKPGPGWLSNVCFGGPEFDVLYATCGEGVYSRKIKARGFHPAEAPFAPPKPGL